MNALLPIILGSGLGGGGQSQESQILDIDVLTQLLNPQFINQITNLLASLNIDGISNISPIIIVGIIAILYLILKGRKEQELGQTRKQIPINSLSTTTTKKNLNNFTFRNF